MKIEPYIRKAAVLGAGGMGAQIAAHLASADVEVMLFELADREGDPCASVVKAVERLAQLEPAPLVSPARAAFIIPANYEQHLEQLRSCDLIVEASAERMDWKQGLYSRIAPYLNKRALLTTNTSGLSIDQLAKALPECMRPRFCGVHLFDPPRYRHLAELIPGAATDQRVLDQLETFLVTTLGKGVIRAKDTPNFIAKRIGVFSMMATMHHTLTFGLSLDLADALTGSAIGRSQSATYRSADLVGLDTLSEAVEGFANALQDDPWVDYLALPGWLQELIGKGALGQKTGAGIYRQQGIDWLVLDPSTNDYRASGARLDDAVEAFLAINNPTEKLAALRHSDHPQAQFLWAVMRDVFHYAAVLLADIADTARDVDLAIRWGFGWEMGPFESWQATGWKRVAGWLAEDIAAGRTLADTPLPEWVTEVDGVHTAEGSYSAAEGRYKPRRALSVYQRQLFPEVVFGERRPNLDITVFETDAVRLWHTGDDIAILSFRTKLRVIADEVLDGILEALKIAEEQFRALVVVWYSAAPVGADADLSQVTPVFQASNLESFEQLVTKFQYTTKALHYAHVPVVGAAHGLILGGGYELLMHCDKVVVAMESYLGLAEVGMGLLPAGGGCKELSRRAADEAKGGDTFPFIERYFETVITGMVTQSAEQARQLGLLKASDCIIFNPHELLYVAKAQALALADTGYRSPLRREIKVVGRAGIATLKMAMLNRLESGFISERDYAVGCKLAETLCGGDVDAGAMVSEDWLLNLERNAFLDLVKSESTRPALARC